MSLERVNPMCPVFGISPEKDDFAKAVRFGICCGK
jgi:hypothetical protein